jgi:urocanate hydratase
MAKLIPNGDALAASNRREPVVNLDSAVEPHPGQAAVYRLYLKLQSIAVERFAGSLAGKLVLNIGFDLRGSELALATTIAGSVFLGVDPDPQSLKAAVRNGSCDFMVNTLDESLRVLKNELRKRTPLSAGLLGNASEILPAMVERGVQPELIAGSSSLETLRPAFHTFAERGAEILAEMSYGPAADEVTWTAANPQDLRRMDKIALDLIPPEDQVRRRWLERAPGSFYRQIPLQRVVGLRLEERGNFLDALKTAAASLPFHSSAEVRWLEADGVERAVSL